MQMSSLKRGPTSPLQNQPKMMNATKTKIDPQVEGSRIIIEVFGKNESDYFGVLSDEELVYVWEKILGHKTEEIFGL